MFTSIQKSQIIDRFQDKFKVKNAKISEINTQTFIVEQCNKVHEVLFYNKVEEQLSNTFYTIENKLQNYYSDELKEFSYTYNINSLFSNVDAFIKNNLHNYTLLIYDEFDFYNSIYISK